MYSNQTFPFRILLLISFHEYTYVTIRHFRYAKTSVIVVSVVQRETLVMYARIAGIKEENISVEVNRLLREIMMEDCANKLVEHLR